MKNKNIVFCVCVGVWVCERFPCMCAQHLIISYVTSDAINGHRQTA
jgi:hypothetical protein